MNKMRLQILTAYMVVCLGFASAWAGLPEDEALRTAAQQLDLVAVKAAIEKKANPNAPSHDKRPMTPLGAVTIGLLIHRTEGAKDKALAVAKYLISKGAKLGPFDKDILFFPISRGHVQLVALFLDHGASPTVKVEGYTPTELAIKYDQQPIYDLLVARGGVPVKKSTAAQVALIEAAENGDIARMEDARKKGALINGADPDGRTALISSVRKGVYDSEDAETILWLLSHGADPNETGESGFQGLEGIPLHIFVFMNKHSMKGVEKKPEAKALAEKVMHQLLEAGAKVSGMDSQGLTPLHQAARADNVRAAEILIHEGARIMAKDRSGKTPLDYAESSQMIRLLKANGASERP